MRLKTEIIIAAELKTAQNLGLFATILKKGDLTAGQIYIVIRKFNTDFILIGPPFGTSFDEEGQKLWCYPLGQGILSQQQIDGYLSKIQKFDPDIFILEIEDPLLNYRPNGIFVVNDDEISSVVSDAEQLFKPKL